MIPIEAPASYYEPPADPEYDAWVEAIDDCHPALADAIVDLIDRESFGATIDATGLAGRMTQQERDGLRELLEPFLTNRLSRERVAFYAEAFGVAPGAWEERRR